MDISRRDFLKLFGISVASVMLTRCTPILPIPTVTPYKALPLTPTVTPPTPIVTCYTALPPTAVTPAASSVRERLRQYWFSFDDLGRAILDSQNTDNIMGTQLVADHRAALDEIVARGELNPEVADLVQESYESAIQHIWRSNAPITCYLTAYGDYTPSSAQVLVDQSIILEQVSADGTIDPSTLETARVALEHDMAFYTLTDQEVQALYEQLSLQTQNSNLPLAEFNALPLDLTPEAREAAQFILDLLTGK